MSVILITIICKNITNCTQECVRNAEKNADFNGKSALVYNLLCLKMSFHIK